MAEVTAERRWSDAESDATFRRLGDRVITTWRRLLRSPHRRALERSVYSVGDVHLTPAQVDGLEVLARSDDLTMQEVAAALGVDPSTATRTVEPLVRLGLAERERDEKDRRYAVLRATAQGRAQASEVEVARRALMRRVLERMAPERRLLFAEMLAEWLQAIEDEASGDGATAAEDRRGSGSW